MKTRQQSTGSEGSERPTEELAGFCNKPIHSVGLNYLPGPHRQGQLYSCDTLCGFLELPGSRDADLHRDGEGPETRAGTRVCHRQLDPGGLVRTGEPPESQHLPCKGLSLDLIRLCISP